MKTVKSMLHAFGFLLTASTLSLGILDVASAGAIFTQGDAFPTGMDVVRFPVTATTTGPAKFVTGVVGGGPVDKRPVIEFTSATDQLLTNDGSPFSTFTGLTSTDDNFIQNFSVQLDNGMFTSFSFTAYAETLFRNPAGRFATITVYEADGGIDSYTQILKNNSNTNRLLIKAEPGDFFTRVDFTTTEKIESVRQLHIDGVVPEPSALWILAAGLLGITLVRRSKRN